ncbi:MAG: hypothetical protein MUF81_21240, partial [Verrucomicrobia bacterium]|nr:hypothetical protein [Verrucomicrobiota bacterium]
MNSTPDRHEVAGDGPAVELLTAKQVAVYFLVKPGTFLAWVLNGLLRGNRVPPEFVSRVKGRYLFDPRIVPFIEAE